MKINIFIPAFNVGTTIGRLISEFADVEMMLKARGHELRVLVINDNSTDNTKSVLDLAVNTSCWLEIGHNNKNIGNAGNIIAGYRWGVQSGADVVGCIDSDGEHSPYAMIRHLQIIESGQCDGVVGSIIFPDHNANHHDRNMMRYHGGMQSALAGVDGMFYIQSPGYNLHQTHRVKKALEFFEGYKKFFTENTSEEFPRWGLHGVIIHLIAVGTGAHVKAAYLECFGQSPNRTPEKLLLQANAANVHCMMLAKFMPKP
jgi:glycosyltransferase involved in cell wall biosynthesis